MLSRLPSKIAYSTLAVDLENGRGTIQIPRRELWDVRVQLMAEEESNESVSDSQAGLGEHDVKTGIYEGGFKSWESSVDLVKVLASENVQQVLLRDPCILMEVCRCRVFPSSPFMPRCSDLVFANETRARIQLKFPGRR